MTIALWHSTFARAVRSGHQPVPLLEISKLPTGVRHNRDAVGAVVGRRAGGLDGIVESQSLHFRSVDREVSCRRGSGCLDGRVKPERLEERHEGETSDVGWVVLVIAAAHDLGGFEACSELPVGWVGSRSRDWRPVPLAPGRRRRTSVPTSKQQQLIAVPYWTGRRNHERPFGPLGILDECPAWPLRQVGDRLGRL